MISFSSRERSSTAVTVTDGLKSSPQTCNGRCGTAADTVAEVREKRRTRNNTQCVPLTKGGEAVGWLDGGDDRRRGILTDNFGGVRIEFFDEREGKCLSGRVREGSSILKGTGGDGGEILCREESVTLRSKLGRSLRNATTEATRVAGSSCRDTALPSRLESIKWRTGSHITAGEVR